MHFTGSVVLNALHRKCGRTVVHMSITEQMVTTVHGKQTSATGGHVTAVGSLSWVL
jgi:hypothetical protein